MRSVQTDVLNLRLPAALRRDLDGAARASGGRLSPLARRALVLGLKAISGNSNDDPPPPAAPSAAIMPAAA